MYENRRCKEEPAPHTALYLTPLNPMDSINIDYCKMGSKDNIVAVDRATGFVKAEQTNDKTTKLSFSFITRVGNQIGVPLEVQTHSGPLVWATFSDWLASMGVDNQVSSSYHPQGNGLSERKIKALKGYLYNLGLITGDKLGEVILEINRTIYQVPGEGSLMERFLWWIHSIRKIVTNSTSYYGKGEAEHVVERVQEDKNGGSWGQGESSRYQDREEE